MNHRLRPGRPGLRSDVAGAGTPGGAAAGVPGVWWVWGLWLTAMDQAVVCLLLLLAEESKRMALLAHM
jgi:hypothetical protein